MKIRKGFVSNSSSSSFIMEINSSCENICDRDEIEEFFNKHIEKKQGKNIFIFNKNGELDEENYGWNWLEIITINHKLCYLLNSSRAIISSGWGEDYDKPKVYKKETLNKIERALKSIAKQYKINLYNMEFDWSKCPVNAVDHNSMETCDKFIRSSKTIKHLLIDKNLRIMNGNDNDSEQPRNII